MYSKRREGIMESTTVFLILLLITIIVIFPFVLGNVGMKAKFMHKMCTWSIVFKDKFILGSNLCYTDDDEIKAKDKNTVMKEIADRMVECWERMDEGRTTIDTNLFLGGYKCFKCYRIKISELKEPIKYKEFLQFLIDNDIKGSDDSYYNFFKKYDMGNQIMLFGPDNSEDGIFIDPRRYDSYNIAFKGYTGLGKGGVVATTLISIKLGPYGALVGATSLAVEGIRYWASENSIIVAPYDSIDEVCPNMLR